METNRVVEVLPNASSTEAGYASAIKMYEDFAKHNGYPSYEDLTTADLLKVGQDGSLAVMELFRKFGSYLLLPISKSKTSDYYKPGSAAQYFSSLKVAMSKRFNTVEMLQNPKDEWCNQLYRLVKMSAAKRAMKNGEALSDGSDSIWRAILISICQALILEATALSYMYRAVMVTLYSAVGRASETATCAWDQLVYNTSLQAPQVEWKEIKTGKSAPLAFFPDCKNYEMCWFHCMFCYLVCEGGGFEVTSSLVPDGIKFLFPNFVYVAEATISSNITNKLHALAKTGKVAGLTDRHSSHGLKSGSADDCTYHKLCTIIALVSRGNWDYSGQVSLCPHILSRHSY